MGTADQIYQAHIDMANNGKITCHDIKLNDGWNSVEIGQKKTFDSACNEEEFYYFIKLNGKVEYQVFDDDQTMLEIPIREISQDVSVYFSQPMYPTQGGSYWLRPVTGQLRKLVVTTVDSDECSTETHNCNENATCINLIGSY